VDLSVVIPTLNEAVALPALLADLKVQRDVSVQVIVADGASSDATTDCATRAGAAVVIAPRGRGAQMNSGARAARAATLLFLHADSRLEHPRHLREALDAIAACKDERVAGHWPLRFARTQPGNDLFYRYMEEKTALNRDGTINGDQGLLVSAKYFRELGGFDERLPFLEDQRIAAKVFASGRWLTLPGVLTTSARRFETEGPRRRYTLMSLIMGLHAAGADEYFARAREVYAAHDASGALRLGPHLALVRRVLREAGWRRACEIVLRAGRYTRQNSWQPFFWCDVALRLGNRPWLRWHDRLFAPLTNNVVCDAITAALIALWFLLLLPVAAVIADPRD